MNSLYYRAQAYPLPGLNSSAAEVSSANVALKLTSSCWLLVLLFLSCFAPQTAAAQGATNCDFRTYTQNSYGSKSRGNSPYDYVQANFQRVFPGGLTVGCTSGRTLRLTSATALTDFLPATGGSAQALNASYTNPTRPRGNSNRPNTYGGEFAGQVVALSLSVIFDAADPSFGVASLSLRDATVVSGPFAGRTVGFVLAQANLALGGCSSQFSLAQLHTVVKAINEAYNEGKNDDDDDDDDDDEDDDDGDKISNLLSCTTACNVSAPVVAAPLTYCQGVAATPLSSGVTLANGATLRLYANATGGTALASDFRPSTTTVGTTTYYAAQVVGSCESSRTPLVVTVGTGLAAPAVSAAPTYCLNNTANPLSGSVAVASGATARLYANATGGTPLASDFRPSTTTVGNTTYYASQVTGSCESGRIPLVVAVVASPGAPAIASTPTYCQGATAAPLSSNLTLLSGATARLYTSATGGTALASDFRPATNTVGSTTYYASQVLGSCESSRMPVTVAVGTGFAAPVVNTIPTYCLNASAAPLSASIALASGAALRLYTTATGGTPLASDFRPSTSSVGNTTYYAAQVSGSCESTRVPLTVAVVSATDTPTFVASLVSAGRNIATWGDSFLDANYGLFAKTLSQLSGYTVFNGGIGGQTSVQIKDRMLAATDKRTWPVIIWAGRNDVNNPTQVRASIAKMVASLPHKRYLVLSVFNGAGEGKGTSTYNQVMTLNSELARIYGNHYLDARSYIVSKYKPGVAQDVADHNADIPPTSLRQDFLHPNADGSNLVANYVYANFNRLLSSNSVILNYCQGTQPAPLSDAFNASAGTTLRFYNSPTATTALGSGTSYLPPTTAIGSVTYYVAQAAGDCESARVAIEVHISDCTSSDAPLTDQTAGLTGPALDYAMALTTPVLSVYPNPVGAEATVNFSLPTTQSYALDLYYATGRLVKQLSMGTATAGQRYSYSLSDLNLPDAIYILRLTAGNTSKIFRMSISK